MAKKKIKHPIPGFPQEQTERKPERVIPSDIDTDVDNMMEALLRIKKDWKLLIGMTGGMDKRIKELEAKIEKMESKKK